MMEISMEQFRELDRHARAYGWEIGRGKKIGKAVTASSDNPFLKEGWDSDLD